ncbi:PQ-loop domain-containing transporter [Mesomycoplasma neurolyticum]|uniref:PQ loop repeat n=1 Tax=Mesomycoplasma neurolyticum TaxID=2120 RepID=A0A449A6M7_9BACT|nr:PQ-loop domain-containing transporter [Mesomycoplasma neurolyticum]VEU59813.1 Uncharacterised protein [Mesomycoplasma neurolyticum]
MESLVEVIIGWIAAILTIIFGLPQLYKVWKYKLSKINLLSFYILYVAIMMWSLFGALFPEKKLSVLIANIISFLILQVTIILILKNQKVRNKFINFVIGSVLLSIIVISFDFVAFAKKINAPQWLNLTLSIIAVSGTSFAFLPQTIKGIMKWKVEGISLLMLIFGFLINLSWEIFWILVGNYSPSIIYILIVQIIAMILYLIQMVIILSKKIKR